MESFRKYGFYRSEEPHKTLPRAAWRLNNDMELRGDELLVDLKLISVNEVGFNQLYGECGGSKNRMIARILSIIKQRGKFHNPITGTGGCLYGTVACMGPDYPNLSGVAVGDNVLSFSSITLIPIQIERILDIDLYTGQIKVEGQAVLYSHYPIVKQPADLPVKMLLSVLDHAGTVAETTRITSPGERVVVLGASGKIGLTCSFAARERIGPAGELYGLVNSEDGRARLQKSGLFDGILTVNATNLDSISRMDPGLFDHFDRVVNCINYPNTEFLSVALCRDGGSVYFSTLSGNPPMASLTAEGVSKDVEIVPYKGIVHRHADLLMDLLRRNPSLIRLLETKFNKYSYKTSFAKEERQSVDQESAEQSVGGKDYVFESEKIKRALVSAKKVAGYDSTVLLYGDTGTGKEIMARIIHENSRRSIFPYVKINCASIPENLLESELFGYEKGAFTGADPKGKAGYWEMAQNGTLFLDEVAEISLPTQAKLLRAIQENEIYRVGGAHAVKTNVRIIAATNKDLRSMVRAGTFREDLYYRLEVYPVHIPPLSQRKADIIPLVKLFNRKYNEKFDVHKSFSTAALARLRDHPWEGNVRELQNFVQRVLIESEDDTIHLSDVEHVLLGEDPEVAQTEERGDVRTLPASELLSQLELEHLAFDETVSDVERYILQRYKDRYGSTRKMAAALELSQNKVVRLLKKYHIGD